MGILIHGILEQSKITEIEDVSIGFTPTSDNYPYAPTMSINFNDLHANHKISLTMKATAYAEQEYYQCTPAPANAHTWVKIENQTLTADATEHRAAELYPMPNTSNSNTATFYNITKDSSITYTIDINKESTQCGESRGTITLQIQSISVSEGLQNVTINAQKKSYTYS